MIYRDDGEYHTNPEAVPEDINGHNKSTKNPTIAPKKAVGNDFKQKELKNTLQTWPHNFNQSINPTSIVNVDATSLTPGQD